MWPVIVVILAIFSDAFVLAGLRLPNCDGF